MQAVWIRQNLPICYLHASMIRRIRYLSRKQVVLNYETFVTIRGGRSSVCSLSAG